MRFTIFIALLVAGLTAVNGQVQPPPVSDNASPSDRSLKDRSIEMERVKREESKGIVTGKPGEAIAQTKFNEIKEDFEQIQVTQSAIVAAYQTAKVIDYKLIATGAREVGKRGTRLKENLFPPVLQKDEKKKKEKKVEQSDAAARVVPGEIKTLISEIDNTLAVFVANAMFSNSRVVNAADHARAKSDLEYVIALSERLNELASAQVPVSN